ncbi:MAG TPA: sugar ABC transporter ATP-binding protein [Polyangia bacterium]|nr:sugar ABC transporter ATP-binding protein [Polyangia bacterium]
MTASPVQVTSAPLLTATGIVKRFPGVLALDRMDLAIDEGEIVALLGQNGAGKSTIMQILAGVHPHGSYEGQIALGGKPFTATTVRQARAQGIALVAQEVNVVAELSVAENMFLGDEPTRFGFLDEASRVARARTALAGFGVDVDARASMASLDLATQQLVSIAAALAKDVRLLILDEPTAALTDKEAQLLFERMRTLKARGVSCIFVSHRLAEVFAIADRIVVMRDGRVSGVYAGHPESRDEVVRAMLGGAIAKGDARGAPGATAAPIALEVRELVVRGADSARRPLVSGLDLSIAKGEILGLFGLLGAGCGEAALAIFGAWDGPVTGRVLVNGQEARITRPSDAVGRGIGLIAQDRRRALVHEHTVAENIVMAALPSVTRRGFLDVAAMRRLAADYVKRLAIKVPTIDTQVGTLSGGNQQKVQVARWLASGAKILLLVDPTRGIDVGTRHEINALWRQLAGEGHALLLISSEAEELVDVCDRALVLRNGVLAGEVGRAELTEERLLRMAAGV